MTLICDSYFAFTGTNNFASGLYCNKNIVAALVLTCNIAYGNDSSILEIHGTLSGRLRTGNNTIYR